MECILDSVHCMEYFHLLSACPLDVGKGGWLAELGVVDFMKGIVIYTSAWMSSLAAALVLKRRNNLGASLLLPHNIPLAVIGGSLLWLGWFGFNAGSGFRTDA